MWRFGIFLCLLIVCSSDGQNNKEVCTLLTMCDRIDDVKSEVLAVREEQETQKQILANLSLVLENQSDILRQQKQILEYQTQILEGLQLCDTKSYPSSCAEDSNATKLQIRVPEYSAEPFEVSCDQGTRGGGWTIILRRNDGSEDFYRGWEDYKRGFGQLDNEFFLGLDKIHAMTSSQSQEMLVLLEDHEEKKSYELYDNFRVGPESNNYTLESLGLASGDAGDSLSYHLGMMFSTKDRNNDEQALGFPCADWYIGAWWYKDCHESNLCGQYGNNVWGKGVAWRTFKGFYYSLKRAVMMIRPKASTLK